jgi:amino acid transporter
MPGMIEEGALKPELITKGDMASERSNTAAQAKGIWHERESAAALVRRYSVSTEDTDGPRGQGLFLGVIFPCMANILGVLLFLRLPWIIGKAGIFHGFCLVSICCSCTFVTALSMAAVATNGKIAGGGSYFLISRSLGPALGAGVGLCFYMANSIGAAMYFMGTVEAWEIAAPDSQILTAGDINNIRVTGFCILGVALIIVAGGVRLVAKLGTVFLFIVLGVILCMYLGCLIGPGSDNSYKLDIVGVPSEGDTTKVTLFWSGPSGTYFSDNFGPDYDSEQWAFPKDKTEHNFISLMALWFPAVTGIMAGSNRSSDLRDPAGDIPRGTIFAQGFTSVVYLSFVLLYGCVAPRESLLHDKFFAASASWPVKEVVMYGVMASTIGAGLTSLVSGTRLLSAIAGDRTLPILRIFAARPGKEPRMALLASGILCALAVAIGELNAVAPILTMFFLMCYTCVNMSCAIMELVQDPNWRPRFRYHHWSISVVGAILCIWMMFAISWYYAMFAMIFCSLIFTYATHNSHQVKWGDGWQGMKFQLARNILTSMDIKTHAKNWRPQLLVITQATIAESNTVANDQVVSLRDPELLLLASQLKGGRGITILGGVCTTQGADIFGKGGLFVNPAQQENVLDGQETMTKLLKKFAIEGFGRIVYTPSFAAGLMSLVQIAGLGAFQPNCVVANWPKDWDQEGAEGEDCRAQMIRMVQVAVVFQKTMVICKGEPFPALHERLQGGHIDIWWIVADGGILLLLAYLLTKHPVWQRCRMRLFAVADDTNDDPVQVKNELEMYLRDFRLEIEVHVKVIDPNSDFARAEQRAAKLAAEVEQLKAELAETKAGLRRREENPRGEELNPREATLKAATDGLHRRGRAQSSDKSDKKKVYSLDDLITGVVDYPQSTDEPKAIASSDSLPKKQMSTQSFGSGLAHWRAAAQPDSGLNAARLSAPVLEGLEMGRQVSVASNGRGFPLTPPSSIGRQAKVAVGVDDAFGVGAAGQDGISGMPSGSIPSKMGSGALPAKKLSGVLPTKIGSGVLPTFGSTNTISRRSQSKDAMFLQHGSQLSGTRPCSAEELSLARGLNSLMTQESKESELVLTNLPDMPPGESAFGYFQLVAEMTEGLKRVFLVRGTASEVITAFT